MSLEEALAANTAALIELTRVYLENPNAATPAPAPAPAPIPAKAPRIPPAPTPAPQEDPARPQITLTDLSTEFVAFSKAKGRDAAIALLHDLGTISDKGFKEIRETKRQLRDSERLAALPAEQYEAAFAKIQEAAAA